MSEVTVDRVEGPASGMVDGVDAYRVVSGAALLWRHVPRPPHSRPRRRQPRRVSSIGHIARRPTAKTHGCDDSNASGRRARSVPAWRRSEDRRAASRVHEAGRVSRERLESQSVAGNGADEAEQCGGRLNG